MTQKQMNSWKLLPIKKGQRPLFAYRYILESMSRDIAQGYSPYITLNVLDSLSAQIDIKLLTELYRERKAKEISVGDLFEIAKKLPLIFSEVMVKQWEIKRQWAQEKYNLPQQIITSYSQILDSTTPSDAYQANTPELNLLWKRWFEYAPEHDVLQMLDESSRVLHEWECIRFQHESPSAVYYNTKYLGQNLTLTNENYVAWVFLEQILYAHQYPQEDNSARIQLWNLFLRDKGVSKVFELMTQCAHLPPKAIESLFYKDSALVKKGLLNELQYVLEVSQLNDLLKEIHPQPMLLSMLFTPVNHPQALILNVAKPYEQETQDLTLWPDAQMDIQRAFLSLHQNKYPKILIYGLPGSGKSTLSASLLVSENSSKIGWIPEFNDGQYLNTEQKDQIQNMMSLNMLLLKSHPDNVIIFDGNTKFIEQEDNKKLVNYILNESGLAQIWVVENIEKISAEICASFDVVIYLGEINQAARLTLAREHFKDEDLAYRIAQSTRTPGDIKKLLAWCALSNDESWKNIIHYLSSRNKLTYSLSGGKSLLKEVPLEDDLIDLAGYPEMLDLLDELSDYFNHPEYYRKLNAKVPKGILLTGEPGTGKTHFAKHLTRSIGVPLYMVETSRLAQDINLIAMVFEQARMKAPCVLLMDEIDSLINNPEEYSVLNLDKQKVLNTFLTQLDGVHPSEGVLVIGATHRHFQPDPAAIRAGRLGNHITLSLPNEKARKDIWQAHLANKPLGTVSYEALAQSSSSFSAAEIAEAVNRASLKAARQRSRVLEQHHLTQACDDVFWGNPDTNIILNETEKEQVAIHEAGHALIAMRHGFQVQRITVRPRKEALGAVQWQVNEGECTFSKEQMIAKIELALGGIAAEKTVYGAFKNGGTSDLRYTRELLHHILLASGLGQTFGLSSHTPKDVGLWSEARKQQLEQEEKEILNTAMQNCHEWLKEHQDLLITLAYELKETKEISGLSLNIWKNKVKAILPQNKEKQLLFQTCSGKPEHITIHSDGQSNKD